MTHEGFVTHLGVELYLWFSPRSGHKVDSPETDLPVPLPTPTGDLVTSRSRTNPTTKGGPQDSFVQVPSCLEEKGPPFWTRSGLPARGVSLCTRTLGSLGVSRRRCAPDVWRSPEVPQGPCLGTQ